MAATARLAPPDKMDLPAALAGSLGTLAHVAMLLLDAALLSTAVELASPEAGPHGVTLATALTMIVILHVLVLAWCARSVFDYLHIAGDEHLATFARRARARAAARKAGTTLLLTGGLAPLTAVLLALAASTTP